MKIIASFTLVPIDGGLSLSPYIAACHEILERSGLSCEYHSNGTNIEGEWDEVFEVIKTCQMAVHDLGAKRIHTVIQLGTRTDREQDMAEKLVSVQEKRQKNI